MSKELIKATLQTKGWEHIEQMLLAEANEAKKIKTEGRSYQDIAVEAIANDKVSKAIKSLIRRLNSIKNESKKNKVVYR